MKGYINKDNLVDFCTTNEAFLECDFNDLNALAIEFPGFDGNSGLSGNFNNYRLDNEFALTLAKNKILLIYVFTGPWTWMRDVSIKTTDDIINAAFSKYNLNPNIKILLTGCSMGGLSALSYATYGKYKPNAVSVSCPACDLFKVSKFSHFFAASVYFDCAHYDSDYETAVKSLSPLYFVKDFPKVPYFILWCDKDRVILPEENVIPLLEKMKEYGYETTSYRVKNRDHGEHTKESIDEFLNFMISNSI